MDLHGETRPTISLLAAHPPKWKEDIVEYLTARGYVLSPITTPDEQQAMLEGPYPDVIMGDVEEESLSVFQAIRDDATILSRPLLVLITDEFSGELPFDWADLILPPTPDYIDYQLRTVLRLRDENSSLTHTIQSLRTEIEEIRNQFEELQRDSDHIDVLKNAIVHMIAHELGTPLLQVKSAVYLLAESANEEAGDDIAANLAKDATARLEGVVKNITRLSKAMDPNMGPVMLRDTVEAARRSLRRNWEVRDDLERIRVSLPDGLPPLHVDTEGLSIVLELLLHNGLKFSRNRPDTPVELTAEHHDGEIEIRVRDHGIGIPKDKLDVIFETFYQVDSSTTRRYGGVGIGLAIVRLILERHNSQIRVESQPGKGSTFWFRLKIVPL